MMLRRNTTRLFALVLATCIGTASCAGDSGPAAPSASVSLHLLDAAAITEANTFAVRMRGTRPDSVTTVRVGGTEAIAAVSDSTLLVVMPLGPAGSVTLEATTWFGSRSAPATLSLTRAAGPTIGDPVAASATLLGEIDAEIAATGTIVPVAGVDPAALAAERADLAALRDSLQAQLSRLDPASRSIALSIIRQIRGDGTAALSASAEASTCNSHKERVNCMRDARIQLARKLVRAAIALSYIGGGAFAVVALAGFTVTTALASAAVAGIVAAVLSFAAIDAKTALSDFVNSTYERAVDEVVRIEGRLAEQLDGTAVSDAFTASAVAPITMQPGVPQRLPIQRVTRSTIVGDTFPVVRGVADSVNLLAQRWGEISTRLPVPLRIPARTIGTTPVRTRVEPADFGETSIVSIREGGAVSTVTGSLSDAAPGINLTLTGDPGVGRDLTVRLALAGDGAGRVEFDVPVRFQAAPDSLEALQRLFSSGPWRRRLLEPYVDDNYDCGPFGYYESPTVEVESPIRQSTLPDVNGMNTKRTLVLQMRWWCKDSSGNPVQTPRGQSIEFWTETRFPGRLFFDAFTSASLAAELESFSASSIRFWVNNRGAKLEWYR